MGILHALFILKMRTTAMPFSSQFWISGSQSCLLEIIFVPLQRMGGIAPFSS